MNRQIAQGNLVSAASVTTGKNGRDMLAFTIACNQGKPAAGDDIVEYFPVFVHGKKGFADNMKEYLGKGAAVTAIGKLKLSRSEKDVNVYTNSRIEVQKLSDVRLSGSKTTTPAAAAAAGQVDQSVHEAAAAATDAAASADPLPTPDYDSFDDDIPF